MAKKDRKNKQLQYKQKKRQQRQQSKRIKDLNSVLSMAMSWGFKDRLRLAWCLIRRKAPKTPVKVV